MSWTWTARKWREQSDAGKFWRSAQFDAIETAVGGYNPHGIYENRLIQLKTILDAISTWRVYKQEEKAKKKGVVFESPRTARTTGDKIAAAEDNLRDRGVAGAGESISVRSKITDDLVKAVVAEIDDVLNLARSEWGGATFTDVAHHNNANFRYLVSAQTETATILEYRENTIKNPALIANALISASVITQDSVHVWAPSGFILSAPTNCIGYAKAADLATNSAVAEGHELEKYREILRLHIQEKVRLPAPTTLRIPTESHSHSEVAVLGRTAGYITTVVGIFIIVDTVATTIADIRPANGCRLAATLVKNGTTETTDVIQDMLPCVTEDRMKQYRDLNVSHSLPIIQIPLTKATDVNSGGSYFSTLHGDGNYNFPIPPNALMHGSQAHIDAVKSGKFTTIYKSNHSPTCYICNSPSRDARDNPYFGGDYD